jgi:cysteinyl-tRNA synthetase
VALRLFNTLGRTTQAFVPIEAGRVGMYTCGPTVYNFAHIGNLRTYIFEDVLRRVLEYLGYEVRHVMNVTDVGHLTDDADDGEDKIIKSAREQGKSVWEIAEFFTDAFFTDTDRLNIRRPTVICRATEHIEQMIDLIRRIEAAGYTYQAGGNVYFDTEKFPNYGELALLDRQEEPESRVGQDPNKRNPRDFVLWFTQSKFGHQAMLWDSPWGRGYPGWHIECSAMSMHYLGEHFDIHCGGVDHIEVHHPNEIAQSEGATGRKWVNYWIHGEFLVMDTGKMAKSKGNFVTLSTLDEEGFEPLDYRYFILNGHYRTQLQFTVDAMKAARNARRRLTERVTALKEASGLDRPSPADVGLSRDAGSNSAAAAENAAGAAGGDHVSAETASGYLQRFTEAVSDNLNVPKALAEVWTLVKDERVTDAQKLAVLLDMDRVFGLDLADAPASRDVSELPEDVQELIRERVEARRRRNFSRADEIRDALRGRGIVLEDTPQGTRWKPV